MKKISLPFVKMSGAGNDFIIIDNLKVSNLKKLAQKVCERTNGIGADGLLVLGSSQKADYKMRIINADGSEAEMCGNGARCLAGYIARKHKIPKNKRFTIETLAGILEAEVDGEVANVHLSDPKDYQGDIEITVNEKKLHVAYIDTGVPHTIIFVDKLEDINVKVIGNIIRFHEKFQPKGTNVNFVEQLDNNYVNVRTYERGVEDETKACGTGSVASGIITYLKANPTIKKKSKAAVRVKTKSGEILKISFDLKDDVVNNVWLKGSAKFIAEGKYYI